VRFRILLALMGALLSVASRFRQAIQRQVWLPRVIEIGSDDGVVYHYTFHERRISSRPGPAQNPNCAVRFATGRLGFRVLTGSDRFELMMEGVRNGSIDVRGDVAQFLWFEGVLRAAARLGPPPPVVLPSMYVSPTTSGAAAQYITREPEAGELDPQWTSAADQRRKLVIMRVPAGKPLESLD
jgi:hypothetical protein